MNGDISNIYVHNYQRVNDSTGACEVDIEERCSKARCVSRTLHAREQEAHIPSDCASYTLMYRAATRSHTKMSLDKLEVTEMDLGRRATRHPIMKVQNEEIPHRAWVIRKHFSSPFLFGVHTI